MIELDSGDIVYYSPNLALGLLLDNFINKDGQVVWNYLLRSPTRADLSFHLVSRQQVQESKLVDAISNGRFLHYKMKG